MSRDLWQLKGAHTSLDNLDARFLENPYQLPMAKSENMGIGQSLVRPADCMLKNC